MNEFKVGDYVELPFGDVIQLRDSHFKGVSAMNDILFKSLKPWQPKEGELVCVSNLDTSSFIVHKWTKKLGEALNSEYNFLNLVYEPFIGELPSFVKEMQ